MLTNYHTHSEYCDGKATAEAMAVAARRAGFAALGFSSHAPLPFRTAWNMDSERLGDYLATIRKLAEAHAPGMTVLTGLEIDSIAGLCGPADGRFAGSGLDYSIGSVHYVLPEGFPAPSADAVDASGEETFGFTIDEPAADFERHLSRFYDGDAEAMVADYWKAVAGMVSAGGFNILGHIDLIRKNNRNGAYFDEGSRRYADAAMRAVDALAGSGIVVEINTGGMARGKTDSPYPAAWLLKELKARNVEICVNADAHEPSHLLAHRADALSLAAEAGYSSLRVLTAGGWKNVGLD